MYRVFQDFYKSGTIKKEFMPKDLETAGLSGFHIIATLNPSGTVHGYKEPGLRIRPGDHGEFASVTNKSHIRQLMS